MSLSHFKKTDVQVAEPHLLNAQVAGRAQAHKRRGTPLHFSTAPHDTHFVSTPET